MRRVLLGSRVYKLGGFSLEYNRNYKNNDLVSFFGFFMFELYIG